MTLRRRGSNRLGFTLIDAIVITTVVALVAVAALPTLLTNAQQIRATTSATQLRLIQNGIDSISVKGFAALLGGGGPGKLSQLTTPITTADAGCDGNAYKSANVNKWPNNTPYYTTPIVPGVGLPLPIGIVNDAITRVSGSSIELTIPNVTVEDATALDQEMDSGANAGSAAGIIQWSATAADGTVTVSVFITTVGC
jgi:type II secretory pathway pseudopilin PulG